MHRFWLILVAVMVVTVAGLATTMKEAQAQADPDICNMGRGSDGYWKFTSLNFNTGALTSSDYQDAGIDNCVGDGRRGVLAEARNRQLLFQRQICKGSNCSFPDTWHSREDPNAMPRDYLPAELSGPWPNVGEGDFEAVATAIGSATKVRNPDDSQRIHTIIWLNPNASSLGTGHGPGQFLYGPADEELVYGALEGRNFYLLKTDCVDDEEDELVLCDRSTRHQVKSLRPDAPARNPSSPSGLRAEPNDRRVTFIWDDPGDNTITRYEYRYSVNDGDSWTSWRRIDAAYDSNFSVCGDKHCQTVTISNLRNGVEVDFQVKSINVDGESSSGSVSETPMVVKPDTLSNLRAAGFRSTNSIEMTWDNPNDPTITGYQYRYRSSAQSTFNDWRAMPGSRATTTSYTVSGLSDNTHYFIEIRAINSAGESPEAVADASTSPNQPSSGPPPQTRPEPPPWPYGAAIECSEGPDNSIGICAVVDTNTWHWHLRSGSSRNAANTDHVFHNHVPLSQGGVGPDGHRH